MSLLEWLGLAPETPRNPEAEIVHRISAQLDSMDPADARHLSLFAFLLARVANVDFVVEPAEVAEMERLVATHGGLDASQAAMVVEIAKATQRMLGPTHNFVATRELRDAATFEQKIGLLQCLFAVAAADGVITGDEEEEIRKISRGLLLPDGDYLAVRAGFASKRSVLQSRDGG
ncbi:MAG: TerB family tellurite resistance protein [Deltaproteobacteria bacterium]